MTDDLRLITLWASFTPLQKQQALVGLRSLIGGAT